MIQVRVVPDLILVLLVARVAEVNQSPPTIAQQTRISVFAPDRSKLAWCSEYRSIYVWCVAARGLAETSQSQFI